MEKIICYIIVISLLLPIVNATLVEFQPDATNGTDVRLISTDPNTNYGDYTSFNLGITGGSVQRGLMDWNYTCVSIPSGATIESIVFEILSTSDSGTGHTMAIFPVNASWTEGTVTWNSFNNGGANISDYNGSWDIGTNYPDLDPDGTRKNITIDPTY